MLETHKDTKSETEVSEAGVGKSLLEGNGFKVIKKIGSGSYSKVKVISPTPRLAPLPF